MKRIIYTSLVVTLWVILMAGEAWGRPWWWQWSFRGRVKALEASVAALQDENKAQQEQISALSAELAKGPGMIDELTARLASAESKISEMSARLAAAQGEITGLDTRLATAEESLKNVQPVLDLGEFVSVKREDMNGVTGPHVIFEGANVHVRSGRDYTDDAGSLSGLGNLIIGYNEEPKDLDTEDRGGSHNLVVGLRHRFRSWGGLVAGNENTISGPYCSVSGGGLNKATADGASVSGGGDNVASGYLSSVSGGGLNEATDDGASVSGGFWNAADGRFSSVSGGLLHQASDHYNWAAGTLFEEK